MCFYVAVDMCRVSISVQQGCWLECLESKFQPKVMLSVDLCTMNLEAGFG
jgi:hypothetical protein